MRKVFALVFCHAAASVTLFAQTSLWQSGYRFPEPLEVAPGQIVMVTVHGIGVENAQSTSVFAPETELAGFRATVRQPGLSPATVGFLGIQQGQCLAGQPNCTSSPTSFTLVMPRVMNPGLEGTLVLNDRGKDLTPIPLRPVPDKIHVLNTCDELPVFIGIKAEANGRCLPVVQRRGGRLVTRENPVRPGEYVTAWAYGLGFSIQRPGGEPANVLNPPELLFSYVADIFPPLPSARNQGVPPAFAGEIGMSGRYQINFQIPEDPSGRPVPACGAAFSGPGSSVTNITIDSNLKIVVRGLTSSETIGICVQP